MNIELTQEQAEAFGRGESITLTPKQWEPKYNELTLSELKAVHTHRRLVKYVKEFGGNWEADWGNRYQNKYAVCCDNNSNAWDCVSDQWECGVGVVYMSRGCVESLVAKLNSGEVIL